MKQNSKKSYKAPQLTVVSFKAERGYASSDSFGKTTMMSFLALSSIPTETASTQILDDRGDISNWTWQ